jgi:hypothetical protein
MHDGHRAIAHCESLYLKQHLICPSIFGGEEGERPAAVRTVPLSSPILELLELSFELVPVAD